MAKIDPARLFSQLLNTGLQIKDNPTYQVIHQLIDQIVSINTEQNKLIANGGSTTITLKGDIGPPGVDGIDFDDFNIIPRPDNNPSWILGSVIFSGPSGILAQDNANLFWDNTANKLGIGIIPAYPFHLSSPSNERVGYIINTHAGFTEQVLILDTTRAANTAFRLLEGYSNAILQFSIDGIGQAFFQTNIGIGSSSFPGTGTAGLIFGDGTALSGMGLNTAGLYADDVAGTVEMFGINEAGVVTQLTGVSPTPGPQGPIGPVVFIEDGIDGIDGFNIPNPGSPGNTGATGAQGPVGPAVLFIEEGLQGEDGIPGPAGTTGSGTSLGENCIAYNNAVQSVPNNTWTALNLNTEESDTDGFHDNVTNNTRITIPAGKGGIYFIAGHTSFLGNTTGQRGLLIQLNSVLQDRQPSEFEDATGGIGDSYLGISGLIKLVAGDFVELMAFQNSGGALNAGHATVRGAQSQFEVVRVST